VEAAIRALRLDRQENSQDDVDFRKPVRRFDARPMGPAQTRRQTMRVMVLVKATEDSEKGILPTRETTEMFEAMGKYNEELVNAGIMLAGDGLSRPRRASELRSMVPAGRSLTGLSPRPASWSPASGSGKSRTWTRRSLG
jgi:hypothetical protein